jgi:predicted amidophosphoribosyltransferase
MTKRKQADRGFSPAEELSIMVGRTVRSANSQVFLSPNFLLKVKETKPQSKKHRIERLLSINRAFQVNDCAIPALLQYVPDLIIVVDDVYTTGATITEIWDNIKKHAIFEQLPKTTWISFSFARSLR